MPPQPATLVEGKYEVLSKIREGGMGTIYKVRHRLLDEIRVIKVMRPNVASDEEFRRRFTDEAKTATRLKHPNICAIYDFALDADGSASLVMEYIDGVTLSDLLKAQKCLDLALALEITHQTLLALGYLHKKKIVHRDIAPDNLMLTVDEDGKSVVKLIDLGIAKVLDRGGGEMTSTGQFLGKLRYASPEQYGALPKGAQIDGRSDLYSMGLVLYELVTGRRPFSGETPIELMRAHVYQDPLPFEESDPDGVISADIRQIVLRALRKNRDERFATAQEFDLSVAASLAKLDTRQAEEEGPTLILGLKTQARHPEHSPTPSAQDRLDLQFAPQYTPTATTPMPPLEIVGRTEELQLRERQELEQIREREEKGDRAGLEEFLALGTSTPAGVAEARAALDRVVQREAQHRAQQEASDWAAAAQSASPEGWDRYSAAHPNSPRAEEAARRRNEALDFRNAASAASEAGWTTFLAKWPEGALRAQALAAVEAVRARDEKALQTAVAAGSSQAFRDFLSAHPGSSRENQATAFLAEQTDFEAAGAQDTEGAWRTFLEHWPKGLRAPAAGDLLKAALRREEAAWKEASEQGTARALLKFLDVFPSGRHHHEAEGMLRELADLDAATKQGKEGYQRFLRSYPTSRHARDVRDKIRELEERALRAQIQQHEAALQEPELEKILLTYPPGSTSMGTAAAEALERVKSAKERKRLEEEEAEWNLAVSGKREEDWKRFLKRHPDSRRADEARRGLALAIETKMREERDREALERIQKLEAALAEGDLTETVRSQPKDSIVSKAAAAALERVRAERERQRREAEDAEWARAADGNEVDWQRFLDSHPGSPHTGEARRRLAQAAEARRREEEESAMLAQIREHEAAFAEGALDRLARAQPASAAAVKSAATAALARVRESLARREQQAEEEDWTLAMAAETSDSWRRFLDRHPGSGRAKQARHRLEKAQAAERAQAKAAERARAKAVADAERLHAAAPAPPTAQSAKAAGMRTTFVEERSPMSRRALLMGLGAAAAVIAAGILVWPKPRGTPPRPAESTAVQQAPVAAAPRVEPPGTEPTAAPPAAAVEPGELAFNALPWGRVDRIVDASGKRWNDGLPQYTPVSLRLPPGQYTLTVSNPDHSAGLTVTVEVRSGQVSVETGRFEAMDAKAYFRSQGWGG